MVISPTASCWCVCMYWTRLVLVRPAASLYSASPLKHHPTGLLLLGGIITRQKGLIDAINSTSLVKRLRLDVVAIKEAREKMEISDVKLSNCMTKKGVDGRVLLSTLQNWAVSFMNSIEH